MAPERWLCTPTEVGPDEGEGLMAENVGRRSSLRRTVACQYLAQIDSIRYLDKNTKRV